MKRRGGRASTADCSDSTSDGFSCQKIEEENFLGTSFGGTILLPSYPPNLRYVAKKIDLKIDAHHSWELTGGKYPHMSVSFVEDQLLLISQKKIALDYFEDAGNRQSCS